MDVTKFWDQAVVTFDVGAVGGGGSDVDTVVGAKEAESGGGGGVSKDGDKAWLRRWVCLAQLGERSSLK